MVRKSAIVIQHRMVLALVKYIRGTNCGAAVTFQTKSGLKTVGTVHLKEKLEQGTTTSQDGDDLTWAEPFPAHVSWHSRKVKILVQVRAI